MISFLHLTEPKPYEIQYRPKNCNIIEAVDQKCSVLKNVQVFSKILQNSKENISAISLF